jgi:hypothetical protein
MLLGPTSPPIVVRVVEQPTRPLGVADIIVQAIGLTGVLLIGAALLGVVLGAVFIWFRRLKPTNNFNGDASEQYRLRLQAPPRSNTT